MANILNDNYGHQTGDQVLIALAEILKANLRIIDTLGRLIDLSIGEVFTVKNPAEPQNSAYIKILLILSIPYMATGLINSGFPALLPFVREEFVLTRAQVGYYSTFFFISAAALAIVTGNVVDKIGPKKGLLIGIACLGLMAFLYGFSSTYLMLLIFAFITGLGFSIITPSVNTGVMLETPPGKRAISMGIMQSGAGIGGLIGASLMPLLGEIIGWRITIQLAGLVILLMGLTAYRLYHEKSRIEDDADLPGAPKEPPPSFKDNLRYFIANKYFVLICLLGTILAGTSVGAIIPHFTVYLSEDLQISRSAAGLGLGIFQIGGMIGRPAWGWFSDRLIRGDRRKSLALLGLITGILYLVPVALLTGSYINLLLIYIYSFVLGFSAFGWFGIFFVAVGELAGSARTGIATGLALLSTRIGILIAPPVFGLIADITGNYNSSWLSFGLAVIIFTLIYYFGTSTKP